VLSKLAAAMRIINLKDGQRSEFRLPNGQRVAWTVRKRRGRWRLEVDLLPDGTRITTKGADDA
jgi:hypothetical protein